MGSDGTLWLEYPSVGGPSPDIPIRVEANQPKLFRHHVSRVENGDAKNEGALSWVGASGLEGIKTITIRPFVQPNNPDLNDKGDVQAFRKNALNQLITEMHPGASGSFDSPKPFTVRLHFSEVDNIAKGKRVFDVLLQGKVVLTELDIAAETNGGHGCLVKEFKNISIVDTLQIALLSKSGQMAPPLICGIELIAEESSDTAANQH